MVLFSQNAQLCRNRALIRLTGSRSDKRMKSILICYLLNIPYPGSILLDKTRIWLGMARKAFYILCPRFILLDKTRICLEIARKTFYIPYLRFIISDKTRISLGNTFHKNLLIRVSAFCFNPTIV